MLIAEKVQAGRRTYSFDVKMTTVGDKYLVITESDSSLNKSHRVMVFQEYIEEFLEGMEKSVAYIIGKGRKKAYDLTQIRMKYPQAYMKWTDELDLLLKNLFNQGRSISELVEAFQRSPKAIRSRLVKLGLITDE